MRTIRLALACLLPMLSATVQSSIIVVGFENISGISNIAAGTQPTNPASRVSNQFQNVGIIFGREGFSTGVAAVDSRANGQTGSRSVVGMNPFDQIPGSANGAAAGDIYFNFVAPGTSTAATVDDLSFRIGDGGGDNDVFEIRAYDLADALISQEIAQGVTMFTHTMGVSGIHRVEIDFLGEFGFIMDQVVFATPTSPLPPPPPPTRAPEPTTWMLALLGLTLLPAGRSRRPRDAERIGLER